jgi:hypothetical protein
MGDAARSIVGMALLLAGCRADPDPWAQLPEPDQRGERVVIATDAAERVCAGTLAAIDAEVERIEAELELPAREDRYRIWILEPAQVGSICDGESSCRHTEHGAVVSADNFVVERRTARELTPLMLDHAGIEAHPFFIEGLAGAMSWPSCPPQYVEPDAQGSWIDYVEQFDQFQELAGELVRWLLDEYGLAHLLDYLDLLPSWAGSYTIRTYYTAYFGSSIEHDTVDHMARGSEKSHCFAPEPEPVGARRVRLQASLDCDSPRVQTDFDTPGFGFVEWTLPVSLAGIHRVYGELPDGSRLAVTSCACDGYWVPFEPFDSAGEVLVGELQQLRWHGPLDAGLELDIELELPCSVSEQDCPAGEKCLDPELPCQPLADEPLPVGQLCSVAAGEPDPCVAKARCVGEPDANGLVTGSCVRQCFEGDDSWCEAGEQCAYFLDVCGGACSDPFGDDCGAAELACTPTVGKQICLPTGPGTLLEPCELFCAPGFFCDDDLDTFCEDTCCVPLCDPTIDDADCPPELPDCKTFTQNPSVGFCGPEGDG